MPQARQKETIDKWEKMFNMYEGAIPRAEYKSKEVMENLKIIRLSLIHI